MQAGPLAPGRVQPTHAPFYNHHYHKGFRPSIEQKVQIAQCVYKIVENCYNEGLPPLSCYVLWLLRQELSQYPLLANWANPNTLGELCNIAQLPLSQIYGNTNQKYSVELPGHIFQEAKYFPPEALEQALAFLQREEYLMEWQALGSVFALAHCLHHLKHRYAELYLLLPLKLGEIYQLVRVLKDQGWLRFASVGRRSVLVPNNPLLAQFNASACAATAFSGDGEDFEDQSEFAVRSGVRCPVKIIGLDSTRCMAQVETREGFTEERWVWVGDLDPQGGTIQQEGTAEEPARSAVEDWLRPSKEAPQKGLQATVLRSMDDGCWSLLQIQGDAPGEARWIATSQTLTMEVDGIDLSEEDFLPAPDLCTLVERGHSDGVQSLLRAKADVEGTNEQGETAFMLAVQTRQAEIAQLLLDHGADGAQLRSETDPVFVLVRAGHTGKCEAAFCMEPQDGLAALREQTHELSLAYEHSGRKVVFQYKRENLKEKIQDGLRNIKEPATLHQLGLTTFAAELLLVLQRSPEAVTGSADNVVRVWDIVSGTCLRRFEGFNNHSLLAFPGRRWIAMTVADKPHMAEVINLDNDKVTNLDEMRLGKSQLQAEDRRPPPSVDPERKPTVSSMGLNREGTLMVVAQDNGTLSLIDTGLWMLHHILEAEGMYTYGMMLAAISPDSVLEEKVRVAATARSSRILCWEFDGDDFETDLKLTEYEATKVTCVAFSPSGALLAASLRDGTVKIWETATSQSSMLRGHTGAVHGVRFSPDERFIATASRDKTAKIWAFVDGRYSCCCTLEGHSAAVNSIAFSPEGDLVITGAEDATAKIWSMETGTLVATLAQHGAGVSHVAFIPARPLHEA